MQPAKKIDILGYGSVSVDDLLYVPYYPESDTKIEVVQRVRQAGGLTGTAMVTAARLGVEAGVFGLLGMNELSDFTREAFIQEGVDITRMKIVEGANPIFSTIVINMQSGERTIFYSEEGFNPIIPNLIPENLCEDIRFLFTDSCVLDHYPKLFSLALRENVPIIVDIETKRIIEFPEQFKIIDYLILNRALASEITSSSDPVVILDQLSTPSRQCSVITQGDRGCWIKSCKGEVFHFPAYSVEVVDTTGCGDVFHGAFAAALIHGEDIFEAIRWASAAAALKATKPGGREGVPSLDVLMDFFYSQPDITFRKIH